LIDQFQYAMPPDGGQGRRPLDREELLRLQKIVVGDPPEWTALR
jgi:hypothetical protein